MLSKNWQGWLEDWEQRQVQLLQRHEETIEEVTRSSVEALKTELLERFGQMEKQANVKKQRLIKMKEEFARDTAKASKSITFDSFVGGAVGASATPTKEVACQRTLSAPTTSPTTPYTRLPHYQLNHAIHSAVGGKIKKMHGTGSSVGSEEEEIKMALSQWEDSEAFQPAPGCRACMYHIVQSQSFGVLSGFVIVFYALAAGAMADYEMRTSLRDEEPPRWFFYVDITFTSIFILECVLKIIAEGAHFFTSKRERDWNIFDVVVAVIGLVDVIIVSTMNFGFLRVLRTFRAIRVLRIIKIFSFFKELRLMIASILCCLVSLSSAFALLIAVMYIFAVILLQGASEFLRNESVPADVRGVLDVNFRDMVRTVYSLTQAVSGGRSWGEFAEPFIQISSWYGVLFTFFVAFVIFGVLNILTGVFVEGTSALASVDKELMIQEELGRNKSVINQMRTLFKEIDADGSGTLSYGELKRNLKDERVKAYFGVLQMDVSEAQGLFQLLDRDESGEVSIEEFIMTCLRLKGTARSIDLATMLAESKHLHHKLMCFMRSVHDTYADISAKLKVLMDYHEGYSSDIH